jgi:putative thiamine transport system ATP-binding protein
MALELSCVTITAPGAGAPMFAPLDLRIASGEVLGLSAPSGAGKSSLLAAIAGHLPRGFAVQGQITLNGRDLRIVPAERRGVGVMFQRAGLFAHLSVGDNLALALPPDLRGRAARQVAVAQALDHAGLPGMQARDPASLSGGQRARVALMRALLAAPQALLLDEPFAALDPALRADLRAFVLGHLRAAGIPALLVSHDPDDHGACARTLALRPAASV